MNFRPILLACLVPVACFCAEAEPRTVESILKSVKAPEGMVVEVFALPPDLGYPTALSAALDGTLFVASDENGSLDTKAGRGRIIRCRDTDGDGKADEFANFARMDSPRGIAWDGGSGGIGTLYVVHPPLVTAYHDDDGDGRSDRSDELVKGLGFDLKFRGADHTTNGCRLGIDGWLYIAVGDFGAVKATGKDGSAISLKGGGVVRVRTDGTSLEIVSTGQRNIYDVAVSPTLDLFTRDNTNDGDGWNVRLSHIVAGAEYGYPSLYKNFPEEAFAPMADLGGGSPCGSIWLDEPALPEGLYTVEWGREAVERHPLTERGASWESANEPFIKVKRPTDMDVDGSGRLYVSSWDGATFTYNGPHAGYVLRFTPSATETAPQVDLQAAEPRVLFATLGTLSAVHRQAAQREILRRAGASPEFRIGSMEPLRSLARQAPTSAGRIAAICTLALLGGEEIIPSLVERCEPGDPLREYAVRFLSEGRNQEIIPVTLLEEALLDENPRVRLQGVVGLARLRRVSLASGIIPLVADADPAVRHVAIRALARLGAMQGCFDALDSAETSRHAGALQALAMMHEPETVAGLLRRLEGATEPARRQSLLAALARLVHREKEYAGNWWGTRPDPSGPYFAAERWPESDRIDKALHEALAAAQGDDARVLLTTLVRNKVNFPGLTDLMLAKAGTDAAARLAAVEALFRSDNALPTEAAEALLAMSGAEGETPEARARAFRLLARGSSHGSVFPTAARAFAALGQARPGEGPLRTAWEEFTRDTKQNKWFGDLKKMAEGAEVPARELGQTILVNLAISKVLGEKDRAKAREAVDKLGARPELAAGLLGVIGRTKAAAFAEWVRLRLHDPDHTVAEAAEFALTELGLDRPGMAAVPISAVAYEAVVEQAASASGDAKLGGEIFLRQGCIACHTVRPDEPPKGPMLAGISARYGRRELIESILKPEAKIAQGFETQWFQIKGGEMVEGFVTREGADSLDVRNIAGITVTLETGNIAERGKRETSMMPPGLMNNATPVELASLLAWLESLKAQ